MIHLSAGRWRSGAVVDEGILTSGSGTPNLVLLPTASLRTSVASQPAPGTPVNGIKLYLQRTAVTCLTCNITTVFVFERLGERRHANGASFE